MSERRKHVWGTSPVVGVGMAGLDHVAVTDSWETDTKSAASQYFEQVGGPVPVALAAMARLGMNTPPRFFGAVGDDDAGKTIRALLSGAGVDAEGMRVSPGGRTAHSLVVLNRETGTRSVASFAGAGLPDTIAPLSHDRAGLAHTDGRDVRAAMEASVDIGCILSLDLGSYTPEKGWLFPYCDIIIASKPGAAGAFPDCAGDPVAQTRRFLDAGATVAGVTLGAGGVIIACRSENNGVPVHLPAFPVANVVDTCGAGDLFHGAFLWAWREGQSVFDAATFAQAAVALRIQHFGNAAGQPTRDAVEAFLREHLTP